MQFEEIKTIINRIGGLDSIESVRSELLEFQNTLEKDYEEHQQNIEDLREANNSLWRQIGKKTTESDKGEPDTERHSELTYDKLFNETGGLK